ERPSIFWTPHKRFAKRRVLIIHLQPHTRPDPRAPQLPALSLPNQPVRGGSRRVRKGSKLTPITRYEKASLRVQGVAPETQSRPRGEQSSPRQSRSGYWGTPAIGWAISEMLGYGSQLP